MSLLRTYTHTHTHTQAHTHIQTHIYTHVDTYGIRTHADIVPTSIASSFSSLCSISLQRRVTPRQSPSHAWVSFSLPTKHSLASREPAAYPRNAPSPLHSTTESQCHPRLQHPRGVHHGPGKENQREAVSVVVVVRGKQVRTSSGGDGKKATWVVVKSRSS